MTRERDNEDPAAGAGPRSGMPLRARLLVLAILLIPLNALWIILSEVIYYRGHPTTASLFYNLVFWLCLLLLVNGGLQRFLPRAALRRDELLSLYVMLGITSGLGGHDTVEVLLSAIAYPAHFASAANNWAETLLPHLPRWLVVKDKDAVDAFYIGHANLYGHGGFWHAWVVPVLVWTLFLGTLTGVFLCINVLLRRQWTERERLAFPIVQLPLELTAPGEGRAGWAPLLRNPIFWAGFVLAAGYQVWNGIATLDPRVPMIPVKVVDYGGLFTQRPWSAMGWTPVGFYPFAIGLGVLLPLDLSFSSWFFYLFWKAQYIISAANGWDNTPNFPYVGAQALGAYMSIAAVSLYAARHHIARVARNFLDPGVAIDDADEPISYRAAVFGILIGLIVLGGLCFLAGMTLWVIVAFFVLYLGLSIAITRMRAEFGPPVHDLHNTGPDVMIPSVLGPTNVPRQDLMGLSLFFGFNRAYRGHPMPIQIEGFKMAERTGMRYRPLFFLMLIAGFVGPLCAFWALLHLCYQKGAAGTLGPPNVLLIFGQEAWGRFDSWTKTPQPPQRGMGVALLVGFAFALLLALLRVRIVGFPFHPVGYAIASSWGMNIVWFPMLLAWVIKIALLRMGGLPLYRRALPFFYGLIVGECIAGSLWSLLGIYTDIPTYGFWP